MTQAPTLVLDLDGTLVDTAADLVATLNVVLGEQGLPPFALAYMQAVISHKCMQDWIGGAQAEDWIIEKFEGPVEG